MSNAATSQALIPTATYVQQCATYFDELDAMGMLHNSRFALLVERATSAFFEDQGWEFRADPNDNPDQYHVVRDFAITFHAPIRGVTRVGVHLWVERIGSSAATWGFGITSIDGSVLHGIGHRTIVKLDPKNLRPIPWTPRFASVLAEFRPNGAAPGAVKANQDTGAVLER